MCHGISLVLALGSTFALPHLESKTSTQSRLTCLAEEGVLEPYVPLGLVHLRWIHVSETSINVLNRLWDNGLSNLNTSEFY